jgi:hypothetical protein
VTAVLPPSGPVSLALWSTNLDGASIVKQVSATLPGSGLSGLVISPEITVTHLSSSDFVVATRIGSNVELSRWSINRAGGLTVLASGISPGYGTSIGLQPVDGSTFLTSMIDPAGALVVKSWRFQGSGLVNLDTSKNATKTFTEVAIAGPQTPDVFSGHRAVTAAVGAAFGSTAPLVHDVWGVDQLTGKISLLGERSSSFAHSHVSITPFSVTPANGELFPPTYYATGYRNTTGAQGFLELEYTRIDSYGKPVSADELYSSPFPADQVRLAPLGTGGLVSATRSAQGQVQLVAWELSRQPNGDIEEQVISQHDAPDATSLHFCRLPSAHAEGDYVTGTRDPDGQLRLRGYRSGDRP